MAEGQYGEDPELRPLVLSNVRLTGKIIGYGAHGSVREVTVAGALGAAKLLRQEVAPPSRVAEFVAECKLMSTLRHPNIVQLLGVAFFPDESELPALVMERLQTNLHDLLDPETGLSPPIGVPNPFFPLSLKCSVLHNVACGVAFLHKRLSPIIHRDLSARNVLLDSGMVAKIADLGVARIARDGSSGKAGSRVYMPPGVESEDDTSIDIFSFGIITIFTVGETFPFDPLPPTYFDEDSSRVRARTELERRSEYMQQVEQQLRACGQLPGDHPLIQLIQQCLQNNPSKRPGITEVLHLLEKARAGFRDESIMSLNKLGLIQHLHSLKSNLEEKEAELTRAEETIRREQQAKDRAQQQVRAKVHGPGLTSAIINQETFLIVEPTEYPQLNIAAQLESFPNTSPSSQPGLPPLKTNLPVSPSRHQVSYTATSRGQHRLHVQVNDREINGSPFTVTAYPNPKELSNPVKVMTRLDRPRGIAFNSQKHVIVSEWGSNKLSVFDAKGEKIQSFGSYGSGPHEMRYPKTIVTDNSDNIYLSSDHKLQKFTSSGELIKHVGQLGKKEGEFNYPRGMTLFENQLFVCDSKNYRIQVFDLDLNFVRSINTHGIDTAYDVKFDTSGLMYIADHGNRRVQVMNSNGEFLRTFGEGKLRGPSGLHIANKYVYVSDYVGHCVVVYETSGQFVTLFGRRGQNKGEFDCPRCITSCTDGFIYICDFTNNRIQIF